jgi:hypoxanthine-guanine phosphoribosyltransferase
MRSITALVSITAINSRRSPHRGQARTSRPRAPRSLRAVCLLSKPSRRTVAAPLAYVGFETEDCFVVGYELDDAERCRQLPYLAVAATGST